MIGSIVRVVEGEGWFPGGLNISSCSGACKL
jgi:hypothetical protein